MGVEVSTCNDDSFLMSFNPLLVLIASLLWLKEFPNRRQVVGLVITLAGSVLFFSNGLEPEMSLDWFLRWWGWLLSLFSAS